MATKAQFEKAFKDFMDKTDWVQGDKRFELLLPWGKHRADIMKAYIEHLEKRAEAAEALNKHLELSVRKAEGVSESMRRRAQDAENKLLFTRPAPAASPAELVPHKVPNDVYKVIYQECGGFVDCAANAQTIWEASRAAMLRNIEEAKY